MKIRELFEAKTKKAEAPKPRNFVAKNAIQSGAGAHKDKKKAAKQGDVKHKAKEFAESLDEVSLGDYRKKAAMQKAQSQMSAMFGKPEEKAKALATFNKREKGLNRLKARDELARKTAADKAMADDIAALPALKAQYEQMKAKYKALGGSNWQYADREQNLTSSEREARSMEGPMNNLWRRITAAEKAQGQQGVEEGAEFGAYYYEQLAQKLYDINPNFNTKGRAVELVDTGWDIAVQDLGKKRARWEFNYDEDFVSDFVSAYGWLQQTNGGKDSVEESASAGATSAANVGVGAVYKNKPGKAAKNKDGTVKNALDMSNNLLTGGSIKR